MTHQNILSSDTWMPDDELGHGYDMMVFDQGEDYSGKVRCTVVRFRAEKPSDKGVLYIHGFADYFFQSEMASQFARHGYNFYAVDLRKYGRSLLPGNKPFEVRDLREYFDDIRSGLASMERDGVKEIILMGHSTGGLVTSLFMQIEQDSRIKALILNSPFLVWNILGIKGKLGIPAVAGMGRMLPGFKVKNDKSTGYADSLKEWKYRKDWKPEALPDVDAAWVRAIDIAQRSLEKGSIKVPVLLLHSDKSAYPGDSPEQYAAADGVLNAEAISKAGKRLGANVTDFTVHDGLHDVVLSRPDVRAVVYTEIFSWLENLAL